MKSTGIVRNIDELGRIVVPKEMRTRLGIKNGDPVEFFVEGNKILLAKYNDVCSFCGNADTLSEFKEKRICKKCLDEIKRDL